MDLLFLHLLTVCVPFLFLLHHALCGQIRILAGSPPDTHLYLTGGNRPSWTRTYTHRLQAAVKAQCSTSASTAESCKKGLLDRIHMIERVSSEKFVALLALADAVLHPFPFDGSKTSADCIQAGRPYVTLPTEYVSFVAVAADLTVTIFVRKPSDSPFPLHIPVLKTLPGTYAGAWEPSSCALWAFRSLLLVAPATMYVLLALWLSSPLPRRSCPQSPEQSSPLLKRALRLLHKTVMRFSISPCANCWLNASTWYGRICR